MPRLLIRTFPPNANPNYGGILQAWALSQVVESFGVTAVVDSTRWPGPNLRSIAKSRVKSLVSSVSAEPLWPARVAPFMAKMRGEVRQLSFAKRRMRLAPVLRLGGQVNQELIRGIDGFIVGSDQVWRPPNMNLPANLFDFLDASDPRPRFSYAASFGVEDPKISQDLAAITRPLAQRLDGVSVREESGARLTQELWGVRAEVHVDPTLLVPKAAYASLAAEAVDTTYRASLINYVLDPNPDTRSVVAWVENAMGVKSSPLLPSVAHVDADRQRSTLIRPSVESWLDAFASSQYVVTDSYHGTVFSIIFNVPFITVVNATRGATRFESLLKTFGLQDRMVHPGRLPTAAAITDDINWAKVNARIISERERAYEYLQRHLSPLIGGHVISKEG